MRIYQGYTLLELMVTVAIAGILLSMVVPGFMGLNERNSVATTSNELLGTLLYARSEAVRMEADVTFTPEANGWQVAVDDADHPDNGLILIDQTVDNDHIALTENIADNVVTYNARGRADITVGDGIDISYGNTVLNRVCLSRTGRPYAKSADEGNCP